MPAFSPTEGRELQTYVKDWVTLEEFETLMPGEDIVRYMCYEAVGPEHWTINIHPEEVLTWERDNAVQSIYVKSMFRNYQDQFEEKPERLAKTTRGYGEISPDAVLFLMKLHEMLNWPKDDFTPHIPLEDEELSKAIQLMVENGVTIHDLIKYPEEAS